MPLTSLDRSYVLARVAGVKIAFEALAVRQIVRAVAISPLLGAPDSIEGAINLRGSLVPIVDLRRRLLLDIQAVAPDQFLIITAVSERLVGVRVDDVEDVVVLSSPTVPIELSPALRHLTGITAVEDGALVIYDVASFLSQAELETIDALVAETT